MKRRFFIVPVFILTAVLFFNCSFDSGSGKSTDEPSKSAAKAITVFNFASPAATGNINETNHTIAITVPYGTDVTALVPAITHTGAGISPASGAEQDFTSPVTYTVTAVNGSTQTYAVIVTVGSSTSKAITGFYFVTLAATGTINETNHNIAMTVPYGTDVTALVPAITHTGAGISPASGAAQNFTSSVTYTVTAANGSTQTYTVTVTIAPVNSYTITYNKNDDTATGTMLPQTIASGETVNLTLNAFTKAGWTFAGWATMPNGGITYIDGASYTMGFSNITLYAKWTANNYTITFDKQGGAGGSDSIVATYGSAMPAATAPARTGFVFTGYWDAVSGGTQYYNADMSGARLWDKTEDTALYARWDWPIYNLRDTGPAGGLIFYINPYAATDGWKYLECAPSSTEWTGKEWGKSGTEVGGTGTEIGTGKNNTVLITAKLNESPPDTDRAAQLCGALTYGGYDDWFLPSLDELNQMSVNLYQQGVGGFANDIYWSSSEANTVFAWSRDFNSVQDFFLKSDGYRVRAIRAF